LKCHLNDRREPGEATFCSNDITAGGIGGLVGSLMDASKQIRCPVLCS
jgi:hypothetical protein